MLNRHEAEVSLDQLRDYFDEMTKAAIRRGEQVESSAYRHSFDMIIAAQDDNLRAEHSKSEPDQRGEGES